MSNALDQKVSAVAGGTCSAQAPLVEITCATAATTGISSGSATKAGGEKAELVERYRASMVLSGVGDAMGYHNGKWEFCLSGREIHDDLKEKGGLDSLVISGPSWSVSDDTVMHLATAEALVSHGTSTDRETLYSKIAAAYIESMKDMAGRAPGPTSMSGCRQLKPNQPKGYVIPFNPRGGGCGAAMRAMAIGLRYPKPENLEELIAVSVESGRMTHNLPAGYLGSFAAALFVHFAVQGMPMEQWGYALLSLKDQVWRYVEGQGRDVEENKKTWAYFWDAWSSYLKERGLETGEGPAKFPPVYGVDERDAFYKSISFSGWGGASGHDAPIIAYDALLGAAGDWKELCLRGVLHGGDNDSTGVIAGACYGAMHGYKGVPEDHYKDLEYRSRLEKTADELLKLSGLLAKPVPTTAA